MCERVNPNRNTYNEILVPALPTTKSDAIGLGQDAGDGVRCETESQLVLGVS